MEGKLETNTQCPDGHAQMAEAHNETLSFACATHHNTPRPGHLGDLRIALVSRICLFSRRIISREVESARQNAPTPLGFGQEAPLLSYHPSSMCK